MALTSPRIGSDGSACPSPERLAEYAEHLVSEPERSEMERHLVACRDCRDALLTAAAFSKHEDTDAMSAAPPRNVVWFRRRPATAAAILAAAAALIIVVRIGLHPDRPNPELTMLATAVAAEPTRPVQGRIVGFSYAPPPSITRGNDLVDATPGLRLAAGEVESKLSSAEGPEDMRTLGLAYLVVGDLDRAIPRLANAASGAPQNAAYASDLAAAYLARGQRDRNTDDLRLAIASADRALGLDPNLMEARFNRALALAALPQPDLSGLREYAEREQGPWADEARQRVESEQPKPIVFRSIEGFKSNQQLVRINPMGEPFDIQINAGTESSDFPAALWADSVRCSAAYVGPGVLMTAGHCFKAVYARRDPPGHLVWDVRTEVKQGGGVVTFTGECERHEEFTEGIEASIRWDVALCRMTGGPNVPFEVISADTTPIAKDAEVLLTGYGIDLESGNRVAGERMQVGTAKVIHADASGLMRTCGASLDDGDSGGGTYVYFDPKFMNRVQVAINAWKRAFDCAPYTGKSSEMAGLWNVHGFIERWSREYDGRICGVHDGLPQGTCRNRELPGTHLIR